MIWDHELHPPLDIVISNHKNSITIVMARRLLRPRRRTSSSPKASKANGKAFLPLGPSLVFACSNCSLVVYVSSVWVQVGFVKNRSRVYTTNRSWYAQNLCTLYAKCVCASRAITWNVPQEFWEPFWFFCAGSYQPHWMTQQATLQPACSRPNGAQGISNGRELINVQQTKKRGQGSFLTHTTAATICQGMLPSHANKEYLLIRVLWTSGSLYRHKLKKCMKKNRKKKDGRKQKIHGPLHRGWV